jgi:hypothetical protein
MFNFEHNTSSAVTDEASGLFRLTLNPERIDLFEVWNNSLSAE